MNAIFGAEPKLSGQVFIGGEEVTIRSPYEAIKNGLAMVTENRRETGFLNNFSIKQNISIVPFLKTSRANGLVGLVDNKAEEEYAAKQKLDMNIKCRDVEQNITELSGGNQQKAIVAREISRDHDILLAVQPTRGLDVGAIEYIHRELVKQRDAGTAILLISLELDEVMNLSDRILVMFEGTIVADLNPREVTVQELGLYMAGSKRQEPEGKAGERA